MLLLVPAFLRNSPADLSQAKMLAFACRTLTAFTLPLKALVELDMKA